MFILFPGSKNKRMRYRKYEDIIKIREHNSNTRKRRHLYNMRIKTNKREYDKKMHEREDKVVQNRIIIEEVNKRVM